MPSKRKLISATVPLPEFDSDHSAAEYFAMHSAAKVWDHLPEAKPLKLSKELEKLTRERHRAAKSAISIRREAKRA